MVEITSRSEKETAGIAKALAKKLKGGDVLGLTGNLGSGKTTFLKGLARSLNLNTRVVSPSFTIMNRYLLPGRKKGFFYHFDLYRLTHPAELKELGLTEILSNLKNITAVEWAERAKKYLPPRTIMIKFDHGQSRNERQIKIYA